MSASPSALRHILAVMAGTIVGMLVFFYTGDSDLIFALTSGFGAIVLVYFMAWLPRPRSRPRSKSRAF